MLYKHRQLKTLIYNSIDKTIYDQDSDALILKLILNMDF